MTGWSLVFVICFILGDLFSCLFVFALFLLLLLLFFGG